MLFHFQILMIVSSTHVRIMAYALIELIPTYANVSLDIQGTTVKTVGLEEVFYDSKLYPTVRLEVKHRIR